jgi:hypothetical protein
MKKIILCVCILGITLTSTQAQFIRFGIRGGVSSSSITFSDVKDVIIGGQHYDIVASDAMVGFHFGLFSRIKLANFFVEPELLFTSNGGQVQVQNVTSGIVSMKEQKFNKIDIPVLAGIKLGPARLEVGPVASFVLSSKSNLFDENSYEQDFKKATIGYQAGVGIDILKTLAVDLKYEGNLSKLGNGFTIGGQSYPFDSRNSQLILSFGLFF